MPPHETCNWGCDLLAALISLAAGITTAVFAALSVRKPQSTGFIFFLGFLTVAFLVSSCSFCASAYYSRKAQSAGAGSSADQRNTHTFDGHSHDEQRASQLPAIAGEQFLSADALSACDIRDGVGEECAVCLGEVEEGETARRLPACRHAFHKRCVERWLREHSTCPVCRCDVRALKPSTEVVVLRVD